MIETQFAIKGYDDKREIKPQKETFYSGTTLENLRTCLIEDSQGNLYFDKSRESRHVHPEAIFCVDDFDHATGYALERARMSNDTSVVLEGKLESDKVIFHKLLGGKNFPVEKVWLKKENAPDCLGKEYEIERAQDYFE